MIELVLSAVVGLLIAAAMASRLRQKNRIVAMLISTIFGLFLTIIVCGITAGIVQFGGSFFSTGATMPGGLIAWVFETGGEFSITALIGAIIGGYLGGRVSA